jgi:hypothetical protein
MSALKFIPLLLLGGHLVSAQIHVKPNPKAFAAFEGYRQQAEAAMSWQPRFTSLARGEVKVVASNKSATKEVTGGLIHDWVGATVVENARMQTVIDLLQNYAAYQKIYAPDVVESRLVRRDGDRFQVFLKLFKKKVLSVTINSNYDVDFERASEQQWRVISRSTSMVEVDNGVERSDLAGMGFVWALNAYWLIEQHGADVYLECRSLSLSRDIPFGLGFAIRPFVTVLPMESLTATLRQTARATQESRQPR